MTQLDASLSILVHGASKTGKSTLTSTAPLPICVLDAEGGWRFISEAGFQSGKPLRRIPWDPNKTVQPPRYDGTWDVCIVQVHSWATLTNAYRGLSETEHDFKTLIFDSITEGQRRLKSNLRGLEQMRVQDWGTLLVHMDQLIRDMRDLAVSDRSPIRVVVFIAETVEKNGKWRPSMQGAIGSQLPYFMDIVGYLYRRPKTDEHGRTVNGSTLEMLIGQDVVPTIEAGERVQGRLGNVITEPNITEMLSRVFGNTTSSTQEVVSSGK